MLNYQPLNAVFIRSKNGGAMWKLLSFVSVLLLTACTIERDYFPVEIHYDCQAGQFFSLSYPNAESVVVHYLNDVRTLERKHSASGAQYRDFEGKTYLFTKGDEAMLEWDEYKLEGCKARE